MHQITGQHLINAFGGESQANMRYRPRTWVCP